MSTVEKTYIFVRKEGGGEEHVYEENGWEPSIVADNLSSYTNYRAEGGAIVDGLQATATNRVSFQTLRRNNLTATFNAARRQGLNTPLEGGWQVYYDYTSLYAISSCILYVSQNGTQVGQYQGVADYNTSQMTFGIPAGEWICCGEIYDLHVTVIDIFGQSYTTPVTTVTTDTLNLVSMEYASSTTSSVTFDLDYWLDSGFVSGYLEYWDEGDDPSTVQPQSHFYFYDGDAQVTADGLDEGTTYIFRVTIVLNDGQRTEIYTAYQNASTAVAPSVSSPFYVHNESGNTMKFYVANTSTLAEHKPSLQYSTDQTNWTSWTISEGSGVDIPAGGTLYIRGDNASGLNPVYTDSSAFKLRGNRSHSFGGNVMSLLSTNGYMSETVVPRNAFPLLFEGDTDLVSAANMSFGRATTVRGNGCVGMFNDCTALTTPPDMSSFTTLDSGQPRGGFSFMFSGCSAMTTTPDTSGFRGTVNGDNLWSFLYGCSSITTPPDLSGITAWSGQYSTLQNCCEGCSSLRFAIDVTNMTPSPNAQMLLNATYRYCTNLTVAYYPNTTSIVANQWLKGAAARGTIYVPSQAVKDAIENATDQIGDPIVPSGWEVAVGRP